jgi:uncharacterized LabA/DUF88 family protein
MPLFLPYTASHQSRVMVFVDGENLAIRYKNELGEKAPVDHVHYRPDVYVWSPYLSRIHGPQNYIRRYFYTSTTGDDQNIDTIEDNLIKSGIDAPRIFRKKKKETRAKRVDITLATEMLMHAHRKNYDIAVLVSGDEDFVPLVEAVQDEGRQVVLWALQSGLSKTLQKTCDHYWDIGEALFREADPAFRAIYF